MPIGANKVVTIHYTLKDESGNLLDSTQGSSPFSFLTGHDQVIPKLEEEIDTMLIGGKKNILIAAEDAYGEYRNDLVHQINKENFPPDVELEVGMQFVTSAPDGTQMPFAIKQIDGDLVTIDFNHPLAGKNLEFEVELVDVRDATEEELSHGHVHGPHSHH
ncbi:MAG: FKBP-type peptidyl-prolyl cis-trans isomerase [Ignavibacteria bacterium]